MAKKRKYTHIKDRIMPIEHGSIADEIEHAVSPAFGKYKTKKRKR